MSANLRRSSTSETSARCGPQVPGHKHALVQRVFATANYLPIQLFGIILSTMKSFKEILSSISLQICMLFIGMTVVCGACARHRPIETPEVLAADEEVRRVYLGTEFRLD